MRCRAQAREAALSTMNDSQHYASVEAERDRFHALSYDILQFLKKHSIIP